MARKTLQHRDETLNDTASSSHATPTPSRKAVKCSKNSVGIPSAKKSHGIQKRNTLTPNISPKYVHIRDRPTLAPMFVPDVTPPSSGRNEAAPAGTESQIGDALEEKTVHEDEKSDRIACDEIEKNVECQPIPHHVIPKTEPEAVIEVEALAKPLSP